MFWHNSSSHSADICPTLPHSALYITVVFTRAVADKKYLYHCYHLLLFARKRPVFARVFGDFVKCMFLLSSWQNRARWSKLLRTVSSKISSKTKILTTKDYSKQNLLNLFPTSLTFMYLGVDDVLSPKEIECNLDSTKP